jgi:hypothetical protein
LSAGGIQLQDSADIAAEGMGLLLNCWAQMDPQRKGLTTSEVIDHLRNSKTREEKEDTSGSNLLAQPKRVP